MASTVNSLLSAVGLSHDGHVRWGDPVPEAAPGVYIVALDARSDALENVLPEAPLSDAALDELLAACPKLTLDGVRPSQAMIPERIASYWLADETVLYVGLAGQPLRTRVRQYYNTPLGGAKPHKGGWWLKTLSLLPALNVHFAATPSFT